MLALLSIFFIFAINWTRSFSFRLNNKDTKITIRIGDITKEKRSIVVSTNTSFATSMENNFISPNSCQGAFQLRFYKNNIASLQKEIDEGLIGAKQIKQLCINPTKIYRPVYEIGTVSKIIQNNRNVYFLSLNHINENGQNIDRNMTDFYTSISQLWDFIRLKGNIEELAIPLIGSGKAGICDLTTEEAFKEIARSYIGYARNNKILTELIIYIYPKDLKKINLRKLKTFLEIECENC